MKIQIKISIIHDYSFTFTFTFAFIHSWHSVTIIKQLHDFNRLLRSVFRVRPKGRVPHLTPSSSTKAHFFGIFTLKNTRGVANSSRLRNIPNLKTRGWQANPKKCRSYKNWKPRIRSSVIWKRASSPKILRQRRCCLNIYRSSLCARNRIWYMKDDVMVVGKESVWSYPKTIH